jgi:cytochrome c-type biogenesis protein CcmH
VTAFVAAAALLALLAAAAVLFGPRLGRRMTTVSQARTSAAALQQQLRELEGERARGLLDETAFAQAREDLQRRLLADASEGVAAASPPTSRRTLFFVAAALPVAAAALYVQFGHPQLLAAPPPEPKAAGGPAGGVLAQLEAHLAATPGDARAWVMLARARMDRDEFAAAAVAYRQALEASAKVARDPQVWCEYADAVGMAQGGRLAGQPSELIGKALALDAAHPRALEMAGSAAYEGGDFRAAARYWQQLLAQMQSGSAEHAQLAAAITRAEQRARFTLPTS